MFASQTGFIDLAKINPQEISNRYYPWGAHDYVVVRHLGTL